MKYKKTAMEKAFEHKQRGYKLYKFPVSKVGKILRQGSDKDGLLFEEMALIYLDYIANRLPPNEIQ